MHREGIIATNIRTHQPSFYTGITSPVLDVTLKDDLSKDAKDLEIA